MGDPVQQIRAFSRFHERLLGAPSGPLPEGLSATEARVLDALARQDGLTARGLMKQLGLDAGYLSRLLGGFEKRKLIRRERSRRDKRAVLLGLTPRGAALAAAIEAQAQAQVRQRLELLDAPSRRAVADALQRVMAHFAPERRTAPLVIRQLKLGDAGWIIHRHATLIAAEQGWDLRFEALCAGILADFIRNYDARFERSWIAERHGLILGSLFLTRRDAQTAKLRLLYVEKDVRGMGLAGKLIGKSIQFARDRGYRRLSLFTTSENVAARRIYERLGFVRTHEEPTELFGEGLMGEEWELAL